MIKIIFLECHPGYRGNRGRRDGRRLRKAGWSDRGGGLKRNYPGEHPQPWLVILLFLGMVVSAVVGVFESVVAVLPIVMCFQSLILDMAGNVGTQSLAVTIRVLMDENLTTGQKVKLIFKEMKIGFFNGVILTVMALLFLGAYIHLFKDFSLGYSMMISACVGVSLVGAMVVSSLVGTLTPIFFKKVGVDPAVASGPLITTINDLVTIVVYYRLVAVVLIDIIHLV